VQEHELLVIFSIWVGAMTAIMTDAENAASCCKGQKNRCGYHAALRSPESVVTAARCTCCRIFRIWRLFAEGIQRYYELDGWQAPVLPVGGISRIPIEIRGERASKRVRLEFWTRCWCLRNGASRLSVQHAPDIFDQNTCCRDGNARTDRASDSH
jgi:hypothetical protein